MNAFAACLGLLCLVPVDAWAFASDHFSGTQLDAQLWTVEDPVGDANFAVGDGTLTISLPAGTPHDVWTTGNNSARVMQATADSDFEIEAKFTSLPTLRYQLQGLLVEQDAGNFLRFDYYSDGASLRIFAASFVNGSATTFRNSTIATPSGPLWLRIRRTGNSWDLSYSYDGAGWLAAATFSRVMTVRRGGPFAGNAGASPAFSATVDYFFNTAAPVEPDDPPPGPDTTPPQLLNVRAAATSDTEILVSWSTNEPATSTVQYGLTTNYELGSRGDSVLKNSHSLVIDNLQPDNTYVLRVVSADAVGNVSASANYTVITSALPVIDVWYGNDQTFGALGQPQRWVNILGNVSDPDGIAALTYSLNGGTARNVSRGPDGKRLQQAGDFVVEFDFDQLNVGTNTVTLRATDALGFSKVETVTVNYGGRVWPEIDQVVRWAGAQRIADRAQVVDGLWQLGSDSVRTVRLGYDRIVALGDLLWQNYEVTVPITVHGFDPLCSVQWCAGGGPLVGLLVRWPGHWYWGATPNHGWYPMGAMAAYFWPGSGTASPRLEVYRGSNGSIASRDFGASLAVGVPHLFKMRAETVSGVHRYSVKLWRQDAPEPATWNIVLDEALSATATGGLLLVAHHVDASFGDVVISSIGGAGGPNDTTPPAISNVQSNVTTGTATITWQTDEPASSQVNYGSTTAYGSTASNPTLVTSHSLTLSGLTAATTYQFRVSSADASGNAATSANLSFTTAAVSGSPSNAIGDEFNSGLDTLRWTFRDPRGDSTLTSTGTQVAISVPAGTSHDLWSGANHAPRLTQAVTDGDFEIEVKFDSSVSQKFQLQGLVVERDAGNLIRFDFYSTGTQTRAFAATFVNGSATARADMAITLGAPMYLRVRRIGNQWTQWYSADGVGWTQVASFSHALQVSTVGIFAGNAGSGSNVPAHTALVDYFRVAGAEPPPPDTTPPVISAVQAAVTADAATITWQTNEPASSEVNFGLTADYGSVAASGSLVTSHSITLNGLESGTNYYYRVTSADGSGNAASSAALLLTTGTPVSQALVSDEFAGPLDTNVWSFRDPRGDSSVAANGNQLVISVPAGVSHDVWRNSNHAPRVMQSATDTDFDLEVKFDSAMSLKHQLQGILVERNAQNFLRFDFYNDGTRTRVFAASFVNGTPTVRVDTPLAIAAPMYMRIRRVGDQWTQSWSADGVTWATSVTFSHALQVAEVGVFAGNAGSGKSIPAHAALVDYFRVAPW